MHTHASSSVRIRRVEPAFVRPLRAAILRPGRPVHESVYPLDDGAETAHFAAIDETDRVVGTASVFQQRGEDEHVPRIHAERDPWRGPHAWRLRGMTVIEPLRGTGRGGLLLNHAIEHVAGSHGECLWFHARASARRFYERYGFVAAGDTYDVPFIGEHVFMWRAIEEPRHA